MEEVGELSQEMLPTRRTLRQPKGRNRAKGRQATPPPPGLPPKRAVKVSKCGPEKVQSCTDPWQTSDEADNIADSNTDEMRNVPVTKQSSTEEKQSSRTDPVSEGAVSAEDSDELTLKELSEQLKKRQQEGKKRLSGLEGCEKANELKNNNEDTGETTGREEEAAGSVNKQAAVKPQAKTVSLQLISKAIRDFMPAKRDQKTATGRMSARRIEDTEEEETTCDESSGKYDSEGCDPDALYCICRQKHNKRFMICCDRCQEWFHGDCVGITEKRGRMMEKNGEDYVCPNCSPCASPAPPQTQPTNSALLPSTSPSEEKHGEDKSIKGKIRKASGFGQKRKMKIIEAVKCLESSLPKCIGPGCSNDALQDSVYCGHQCILQHAAQAMRSLTDAKQPKPAVKAQAKCLPGTLSQNRATESPLEGHTEDEEAGDMQAVQLQSDHNHEGVRAQQTAFDSSVFYKPSMYHFTDPNSTLNPAPSTPSQLLRHTCPLYYLFKIGMQFLECVSNFDKTNQACLFSKFL
uniref:PHD-type domain-containing protein n=1 Tax=Denticeps clupeoides TaxID=299321 RepID=A0AAY4E0T0_9TELE